MKRRVPSLSNDQVDVLLNADDVNLAKLVAKGTPLPQWARRKLEDQKNGALEPGLIWCDSKAQLAEQLTITRRTLDRLWKLKGNPGKRRNGKMNLAEWRGFASIHVAKLSFAGETDPKAAAMLRKLEAEADAAEFNTALLKAKYILKSEVAESI